ncbi:hypothetical protein [Streptomyces hydrogenans]|uniref:hypothetical protein n=1 Tax=Streptomyces hydrogenans TaxID=1873719 RepID=UPI0035DF8B96
MTPARPPRAITRQDGGRLHADVIDSRASMDVGVGEEWFRSRLIDVRTGAVGGELAAGAVHPYDLVPLGDGSWLTDGPVRRRRGPSPASPVQPAGV